MKAKVLHNLLQEYGKLKNPKETTAIKYWYQYNNVHVNVYFDSFDVNNPHLSIVLNFEKSYYYTSLNVKNTAVNKEYLVKIPMNILGKILSNSKLDDFFNNLEEHLLLDASFPINYTKDTIFTNTLKYAKKQAGRKDLPFLYSIKRMRMSDKTFKNLNETMGINIEVLRKIQDNNMTLNRTSDATKRKSITILLEGVGIIL